MTRRTMLAFLFLAVALVTAPTRAFDGTDGCIGSVVQSGAGAAKQLRCSKTSTCATNCSKLDVILVFPDETEITAKVCNCDGTEDDNCCSIALGSDGTQYATGRCAGNQNPGQNCPAGSFCGMSIPSGEYPWVWNATCL